MMKAGQDALAEESIRLGLPVPKFLAVTVLTSLDENALKDVGQIGPAETQVIRLAKLTQQAGLAGIVCSGQEIKLVRGALGQDFVLMVPGIRPAGADLGDQKRVMTPREAIDAGATHLVIGRPITGSKDPPQAATDIIKSML
jgi:orotidine-5'-phosphate decarboxylase